MKCIFTPWWTIAVNRLSKWLCNLCSIKTSAVVLFPVEYVSSTRGRMWQIYYSYFSWTRQIIRYRATATLRRPKIKQCIASKGEGGTEPTGTSYNLTKYEAVHLVVTQGTKYCPEAVEKIWETCPGSKVTVSNTFSTTDEQEFDCAPRSQGITDLLSYCFVLKGEVNSTSTYVPARLT